MKKTKNKKLQRKPGRPGRQATTYEDVLVDYSHATTDLINTLFRTVLRNVSNGIIDRSELPPIATIVPMLIMKHFDRNATCNSFCEMVRRNWGNIEGDLTTNIGHPQYYNLHQDKTSTIDDETP